MIPLYSDLIVFRLCNTYNRNNSWMCIIANFITVHNIPVIPAINCMNLSAHSGTLVSSSSFINNSYAGCQADEDSVIAFSFSAATKIRSIIINKANRSNN